MNTERALRIALVSEHASPIGELGGVDSGGQNVYVHHVARCLAAAGHLVDVFTRADRPGLPPVVEMRPGYRVVHVAAGPSRFIAKEELLPYMHPFAEEMRRFFGRGAGYDVVHANFFMSGLVGLELKDAFDVPLVVTFHALGLVRRRHQGTADAFPAARIDIERRLVAEADALIAECPQDESDLVELYAAAPQRIHSAPCGVDGAEFFPRDRMGARRVLGIDGDAFVVLQLGRMVPRKGVDNVIRGAALLPPTGTGPLVLVVGGDSRDPAQDASPEMRRLRGVACASGIIERVRFFGQRRRDELPLFYAAADVFATTPWYEPFGITPLEAMACARPVVGSAVGGIRHTVVDGVTGYLVPPRDPFALAARFAKLRAEPMLGEAMGRAGVRRARRLFTWEGVAERLAAVYAEVDGARVGQRRATRHQRAAVLRA